MIQKRPKVSIVVPVYNVERYLDKCVESLIHQTLSDIEIILVDDGSTDHCPKMCDEYTHCDNRVKVIHKKNEGLSSARNEGMKYVTGEYYMFVDSDDWLDAETCEFCYKEIDALNADCLMFSYIKEYGNHSIVNHIFAQKRIVWDELEVKKNFHRRLFGLLGEELSRPQDGDLIVSACMQLFKTSKFKDIQFVDTKIIGTEDCWYQVLVYENCQRFVYIDHPFYHYLRINDGSLTTKYNPYLFERWQRLYMYMQEYITEHGKSQEYIRALQNRIALSILGGGINLAHSSESLMEGSRHLKHMLDSDRYDMALSQLNISVMPLPWKVFFILAKHKMTLCLFGLLRIIEYLRTHKNKLIIV